MLSDILSTSNDTTGLVVYAIEHIKVQAKSSGCHWLPYHYWVIYKLSTNNDCETKDIIRLISMYVLCGAQYIII